MIMNPSGPERRTDNPGRRSEDLFPPFCSDHKWVVESMSDVKKTVTSHTKKLDTFLTRINITLVTMLLALLAVLIDLIFKRGGL
jgi:uncharacterized protein involved in cysteine biosynthesis